MQIKKIAHDLSFSSLVSGLIVVLVGLTSSAILIFQAAETVGLNSEQASSWLGSTCIAIGGLSVILSLYYRAPVVFAWSTAGAALLVTALKGVPVSDAIGAFITASVLAFLSGATGLFEKLMNRIPIGLAAALLAGVLLSFALNTFTAFNSQPVLIASMFAAYLISKKYMPRYTMMIVLLIGIGVSGMLGILHLETIALAPTVFDFVWPTFSVSATLSIAIPLFVITMTTQNLTGITVMRANGYNTPISPLLSWAGGVNIITSFFGGFSVSLAAITAAITMGPESHPDPKKRYLTSLISGAIYVVIGLGAGTVTSMFAAFPKEMVTAIAGFALLSTILSCLQTAFSDDGKEPAFITFIITASGLNLFGINSAFWGLIVGVLCQLLFREKKND